jgi:hypothetical protein
MSQLKIATRQLELGGGGVCVVACLRQHRFQGLDRSLQPLQLVLSSRLRQ